MSLASCYPHELKLDSDHKQEALELLQSLIRLHPRYASSGLLEAQRIFAKYLETNAWDQVIVDDYYSSAIAQSPHYVDVPKFSEEYSAYESVLKRNIIAVIDSGKPGPTLILNGHMDVDIVSLPEQWSTAAGWCSGDIKGERILGRGATDMLGGLVALGLVGSVFAQARTKWRGKIILCSVCDEEIGGNGTLRTLQFLEQTKMLDFSGEIYALIAEPSDGKVCICSLGFQTFSLDLSRKTKHMGASNQSTSLWIDLNELAMGLETKTRELLLRGGKDPSHLRINLGVISGGEDAAIPLCGTRIQGTFFYSKDLEKDIVMDAIEHAMIELVRFGTKAELNMQSFGFPPSSSKTTALSKALCKVQNDQSYIRSMFPSPCDARLFDPFNIPVVIFGPGTLSDAHAVDESLSLRELDRYHQVLLTTLQMVLASD